MTPREKLRLTSCESLLACLSFRLRAWSVACEPGLSAEMSDAADTIDLKLTMEREARDRPIEWRRNL